MKKFYFTFGTGPQYPYCGGWVEVQLPECDRYAGIEGRRKAIEIFRRRFPDVHTGFVNCADIYTEDKFSQSMMKNEGNHGFFCYEVLNPYITATVQEFASYLYRMPVGVPMDVTLINAEREDPLTFPCSVERIEVADCDVVILNEYDCGGEGRFFSVPIPPYTNVDLRNEFVETVCDNLWDIKSVQYETFDVPETLLDFIESLDSSSGTQEFDLIIGGVDMPATVVWDDDMTITEYCKEKFGHLLSSRIERLESGVVDVSSDWTGMGRDFVMAAAGYVADSQYTKLFGAELDSTVYRCEITQTRKGHVNIKASSPEDAMKQLEILYNQEGAELPDMEEPEPLTFAIIGEF